MIYNLYNNNSNHYNNDTDNSNDNTTDNQWLITDKMITRFTACHQLSAFSCAPKGLPSSVRARTPAEAAWRASYRVASDPREGQDRIRPKDLGNPRTSAFQPSQLGLPAK